MDLSMYREMDPHILYSIINMKMRNARTDLESVLYDLDIDAEEFAQHMATHGYHYNRETNQFRRT